jgi:hypothetical protein
MSKLELAFIYLQAGLLSKTKSDRYKLVEFSAVCTVSTAK